jgi:hypothetical protein
MDGPQGVMSNICTCQEISMVERERAMQRAKLRNLGQEPRGPQAYYGALGVGNPFFDRDHCTNHKPRQVSSNFYNVYTVHDLNNVLKEMSCISSQNAASFIPCYILDVLVHFADAETLAKLTQLGMTCKRES